MTDRILPDPAVRRLAAKLASLESELETVRAGLRATQLSNSTIHGGRLLIRDDAGALRGWVGKQPDGTFGTGAANGDPPSRPNTPVLTATRAGVSVGWNGELFAALPADFSHLLVYVSDAGSGFIRGPSNLVGTLTRAGTLPVGPLAYDTEFWARFVAVNTSGIESVESLTAGPVTPSRLLGSDLFPATITETEIAPDSIGTPQLKANSVTALQIVAEAIKAFHLDAGIVTADKLAAVIAIASQFIAGDPTAGLGYLVLEAAGLTQFAEDGSIALRFGASPQGGNFLTVVDPDDSSQALAAITSAGAVVASSFAVTGQATIGGEDLGRTLDSLPRGIIARANTANNSPTTVGNGRVGWIEVSWTQEANRYYRISTNTARCRNTNGIGPTSPDRRNYGYAGLLFTISSDGTAPTVNDPVMSQVTIIPSTTSTSAIAFAGNSTADNAVMRVLCCVENFDSAYPGSYFEPFGLNGFQVVVEDLGPFVFASGGESEGGATGGPQPTQMTKTWTPDWTYSENSANEQSHLYQGDAGYGAGRSMIRFPDAVATALAGATIDRVELYLYAEHWWYNSGGTVVLGTHNQSAYGGYSATSENEVRFHLGKPEGRWVTLSNSFGQRFRDGLIKGFVLDASNVGNGLEYYGYMRPANQQYEPALRITYTS